MGYVEMCAGDNLDNWFGLLPNGTSNLTLSLNNSPIDYKSCSGKYVLYVPPSISEGIKPSQNLTFINLQLRPFGLFPLLGIPLQEFNFKPVSLDAVFTTTESDNLIDQLHHCKTIREKFLHVEKFLLDRINTDLLDNRVIQAATIMKATSTGMDSLSNEVCLSNRRFRELFSYHTGFSPNFFKKLMRFNRATSDLAKTPVTSLTDVALSNGYFDQSHFIKDFKCFSGLRPSEYLNLKVGSADFYNYRIPQKQIL
jgi:AraC-like DNA-binding protein